VVPPIAMLDDFCALAALVVGRATVRIFGCRIFGLKRQGSDRGADLWALQDLGAAGDSLPRGSAHLPVEPASKRCRLTNQNASSVAAAAMSSATTTMDPVRDDDDTDASDGDGTAESPPWPSSTPPRPAKTPSLGTRTRYGQSSHPALLPGHQRLPTLSF
jgi:hypothetical protein